MANDTTATGTATASAANDPPPEAENENGAGNKERGKEGVDDEIDDEIDADEIDTGEAGKSSQPQQQKHREPDADNPEPSAGGEPAREGADDDDNNNNNDKNDNNNNNNKNDKKPGNASEGGAPGRDPPVVPRRPTKRARTAYFIFADEIRSTIQKEHPGETVASHAKRIGARWKSIEQSEKERFQAMAAREKEVARIELEAYLAWHGDKALSPESAQQQHQHQHPHHHDTKHNNEPHPEAAAGGDLVFPVARIRKIAKLDPEVKTLSKEALQLVVKSTEMALAKLGAECVKVARIQNRRTLLPEDVAHVCAHRDVFGFLRDDIRDLAVALAERKNESSGSSAAAASAAAGSNSKTEKARREAAAGSKPLTSYFGVAAATAANK